MLNKFDVFEVVDSQLAKKYPVLSTRMVDTDEKSRFVAREIAEYRNNDFYAPSSASATTRMVDIDAFRMGKSRMTLDVARASLTAGGRRHLGAPSASLARQAQERRVAQQRDVEDEGGALWAASGGASLDESSRFPVDRRVRDVEVDHGVADVQEGRHVVGGPCG